MARRVWSAWAVVLALACGPAAAQQGAEADESATARADSALLEPMRWSLGTQAEPVVRLTVFAPKDLARGTLLRAKIDDDTSLMLRLRGRRIGLYLSVRLGD